MSIEMHDVSGQPRLREEITEARDALKREIVSNPLAMLKNGTPAVMVYLVAIAALDELLMVREAIERARAKRDTASPPAQPGESEDRGC